MATHSSILAWEIPWTEESDSPWGHSQTQLSARTRVSPSSLTHTRIYGPQSLKYLLFAPLQTKFAHSVLESKDRVSFISVCLK